MTIDRQRIVRCSFPCRFVSARADGDTCEFDLGSAKVVLTGPGSRRMVRRMEEAKRKSCGTFDFVLKMKARDILIGSIEKA